MTEKELQDQIDHLQGQIDCLSFFISLFIANALGKEQCRLLLNETSKVSVSELDGTVKEKGYAAMFQQIEKDLEENIK